MGPLAWDGQNFLIFLRIRQVAFKFQDILRELIWITVQCSAQRMGRHTVGAGCAAQTQVDTVWIQCREGAELFRNHQWRMVGQHDTARTDPQRSRAAGDVSNHYRCSGAGNAGHVVVFGNPITVIAQRLSMLGEAQTIVERLPRIRSGGDR